MFSPVPHDPCWSEGAFPTSTTSLDSPQSLGSREEAGAAGTERALEMPGLETGDPRPATAGLCPPKVSARGGGLG